jgi:cytosine/adenosine deaminase-related metal-dependent hydrolase
MMKTTDQITKNFILTNIRLISMDQDVGYLVKASFSVHEGVISKVYSENEIPDQLDSDLPPIDGKGYIAMPGFVDTHTHMWNSPWKSFLGTATGLSYEALCRKMGPLFTPEDSYAAVYAASLEALSAGVTTMNNWAHNLPSPEHADAELQAMEDAGLRGQFTYGYHYELSPEEPMNVADAIRLRDSSASKRMTFRLGLRNDVTPDPNFPFFKFLNVAPALLKKEIAMAREARLPISMHVLNEGNAEYYAKAGYLNSDNLIIHGYHWDDADWKVLADHQTPVSFSPSTANGMRKIIPLTSAQKNGVQCGLSFDNYAGSGGPNMFKMMAAARINQQLGKKKISDSKLLSLVTKNGAGVLGISDDVGTITPGKQADFMLVKTDSLAMAPAKDSVRALTNTANPSDIDSVYVDGTPVKRNGKMLGIHTADIANDLNSRFERLIRLMN